MANSKIMIVDDDPDLRQALRLRLRANQYETVNAVDGYSAIAMAYKERPDLIILDLGLPAGDGFVVLDRLQKDDKLSAIPVIVLDGARPSSQRAACAAIGCGCVLPEASRQRRTDGRDSRNPEPGCGGDSVAVLRDSTPVKALPDP